VDLNAEKYDSPQAIPDTGRKNDFRMSGIPFTGIYLVTGVNLTCYTSVNHLIE